MGEYDPGAPPNSKWIELYADAPNYRQIGKAILGGSGEKFRWEMGPMFYRGRLAKDQVKVFVVGQEGAQDENVSNRAFTGSTGTKTQNFLNHIGIFRSYLFMNTFVYTINGQLDDDPKFHFMEQGTGVPDVEMSPIVKYRHRLFDHMLVNNSETIALFMGVGSGGKASLATWVNARGGKCSVARDMASCDTSGMVEFFRKGFKASYGETVKANLAKGTVIRVVGVPHPGGASAANGGAGALGNIIRGFTTAAKRVAAWKVEDPNWLPQDEDDSLNLSRRLAVMNADYNYQDAPVPYRDFDFGTNKRMGADGTTSNRWGADAIQVFSKNGVYGDKSAKYAGSVGRFTFEQSGIESAGFRSGIDLPWEPPKADSELVSSYDPGPCGYYDTNEYEIGVSPCVFGDLLVNGWPKTTTGQSDSFGPTSIYRGRTTGAKLLVIADQESHDDFFTGRAITGEVGQRLQTWIEKQNVGDKYLIVRTSPWDTLTPRSGQDQVMLDGAHPHLKKVLAEAAKNNKFSQIVALGKHAEGVAAEFAESIGKEAEVIDVSKEALTPIPRADLPYHSRWWMGTSGNRANRGIGGAMKGKSDGNYHYYRVHAPDWNSKYKVPALTPDVMKEVQGGLGELK